MDKILKYSGIVITVLTILGGAITGYATLQNKVATLNDKTSELKEINGEQDKRLAEAEKIMAKQDANQENILRILDRIEKKI